MNRELTQKVRDFIGNPPRSVVYTMVQQEFPDNSEEELKEVMDFLWNKGLIQQWRSGWIAGRKPEVQLKLTQDDVDWMLGSGRYAQ